MIKIEVEVKGGCDFCKGEDITYFNDYSVQIYDGELFINCDESYHSSTLKINYCPMCGKRL